jgi:hypothetical protein
MGTMPTHSCGNLMFSGHASLLTLLFLVEGKYDKIHNANAIWYSKLLFIRIIKTVMGYYSIIACRSHYTSDVVIGIMLASLIFIVSETHFATSKILSSIEMRSYKKIVYKNECVDDIRSLSVFEQL